MQDTDSREHVLALSNFIGARVGYSTSLFPEDAPVAALLTSKSGKSRRFLAVDFCPHSIALCEGVHVRGEYLMLWLSIERVLQVPVVLAIRFTDTIALHPISKLEWDDSDDPEFKVAQIEQFERMDFVPKGTVLN